MKTCAHCYRPAVATVFTQPICQTHLFSLLDKRPQTPFCLPEQNDHSFVPLLMAVKTERIGALGLRSAEAVTGH